MKTAILFLTVAVAYTLAGKITTKYDDIDIDAIIKNKRLVAAYVNCILTGDKCTAEGQTLRDAIPQALSNGCADCSEKQKAVSKRVIPQLIKDYPEDYDKIKAVFDPEDKFYQKYADLAKEKGLPVPDYLLSL